MIFIKDFFISAAVVTYNNGEEAEKTIRLILENTKKYPLKLYVIDNHSTDNTAALLRGIDGVEFIENDKNIGFGAAHNIAFQKGLGKYHFVINPDIEIKSDVLSSLADFMEQNPDVALSMPQILNTDGTVQYLPKKKPTFKRLFFGRLFSKIRDEYVMKGEIGENVTEIDFCSGCFMCVKGDVFERLHGFDKRYFMYLEDADLTLRAKHFGKTVIVPEISIYHAWQRDSAKKLKLLFIHTKSAFKFLAKKEF